MTPVFVVVCGLLAFAGVVKLLNPASARAALIAVGLPMPSPLVRTAGVLELAVGSWAALAPTALTGILVAVAYGAFAVLVLRLRLTGNGAPDCGCFGTASGRAGPIHVGLNCAACAIAVLVALDPTRGVVWMLSRPAGVAVPLLIGTSAAGFAAYLSYTLLFDAWSAYGSGAGR